MLSQEHYTLFRNHHSQNNKNTKPHWVSTYNHLQKGKEESEIWVSDRTISKQCQQLFQHSHLKLVWDNITIKNVSIAQKIQSVGIANLINVSPP